MHRVFLIIRMLVLLLFYSFHIGYFSTKQLHKQFLAIGFENNFHEKNAFQKLTIELFLQIKMLAHAY